MLLDFWLVLTWQIGQDHFAKILFRLLSAVDPILLNHHVYPHAEVNHIRTD